MLTGIIAEEMYKHIVMKKLIPSEQKGCRKESRGTKDQLLIDRMILRNCNCRQSSLAMAWIDYQKANDIIAHSWIVRCLDIFETADNIKNLITNSMMNWETELTSGKVSLGKVKIRRGIFQGDSLSPLLFALAVVPLSFMLRKVKAGYDLEGNKGCVNHLLFMDDLKLYGKNERQLDTLVNSVKIFSEDIQVQFGVNKEAGEMCA